MRALGSDTGCDADPTLAVLHGLRLKGFVDTSTLVRFVASAWSASARPPMPVPVAGAPAGDEGEVRHELERLAARGLVRARVLGSSTRWSLTPAGRADHERRLAAELDRADARRAVQAAFHDFGPLNARLLDVCTRWQVRDLEASLVNDHTDPAYDAAVIQSLIELDAEAQQLTARLAAALDRFGRYGPALTAALDRVRAGDTDWFARPLIASYHTVWFELHEDLLATLGLERVEASASAPVPANGHGNSNGNSNGNGNGNGRAVTARATNANTNANANRNGNDGSGPSSAAPPLG